MDDLLTLGDLKTIVVRAMLEKGTTDKTPVILASDEEGNQLKYLHTFSLEYPLIEKDGDYQLDKTKPPRLVLWPSDDEWDPLT